MTPPEETLGPPGAYILWVVEATTTGPSPAYHGLVPSGARIVLID